MCEAAGEARKKTAAAMSAAVPARPLAVWAMIAVRRASLGEQLKALFKRVGAEYWPQRANLHLPDDVKTKTVARLKTDFKTFLGRPVKSLDRTDGRSG